MLINKKRLKFSGKDLNINFQLNSKNDIIINSLNNLVENVGNSLINPIIDEEVCRFKKSNVGGSQIFYFYFKGKTSHYNEFPFENKVLKNKTKFIQNSFFIFDFYDSFNSNTQNKIFRTYFTKFIDYANDNKPKYIITTTKDTQLSFFDVPISYINKQEKNEFGCFLKLSFYNAETGILSLFYNYAKYNNQLINNTEEIMYFDVIFNKKEKTWYFKPQPPILSEFKAYELPKSQYVDKINNTFNKTNYIQQKYPEGGNKFNPNTGTYTNEQ